MLAIPGTRAQDISPISIRPEGRKSDLIIDNLPIITPARPQGVLVIIKFKILLTVLKIQFVLFLTNIA